MTVSTAVKVNTPTRSRVFVLQSDWFRQDPGGGSPRFNPSNVTRLSSPFREREPGNEANWHQAHFRVSRVELGTRLAFTRVSTASDKRWGEKAGNEARLPVATCNSEVDIGQLLAS